MNPPANSAVKRESEQITPVSRAGGLCLVVHDDLELRLRLAGLVRRAAATLDADTVTASGLESLSAEQVRSYLAVLLIVEFMQRGGESDPLAALARLRARAPGVPIYIFARHGTERWAARAVKAGAADYWPIHSVDLAELTAALQLLRAPPRSDPAPEVAGYRILKKIAQSSAAAVYLARNDDLAQPVALKVQTIKDNAGLCEEDRQRFARECKIISSLNHRSIADVIDFGITPEYLYLALEYFPCGSLRERLKNPVSEADARDYARQIAEALLAVHAAGVVHRDLKPSNLMLTSANRLVLIDFGSARAQLVAQDLSRSDLVTGTPYYACPEQIAGDDTDHRGDLYSLGIIFYEMLTGNLPFKGSTLAEIFEGHCTAPVPALAAPLSRNQSMINRLLAKNPDDRYPSAAHFLEALDGAPESRAQPTRRTGPTGALE